MHAMLSGGLADLKRNFPV